MNGDTAEVKQLLEAGADVQATNADGETALHEAASLGRRDAVTVLLHAGAAIEATNKWKQSPLYMAPKRARPRSLR